MFSIYRTDFLINFEKNKDFVALNEPRSHTFIHLNASTSYVIGVAAKNTANGTGPSAILNVTTLPPGNNNIKNKNYE